MQLLDITESYMVSGGLPLTFNSCFDSCVSHLSNGHDLNGIQSAEITYLCSLECTGVGLMTVLYSPIVFGAVGAMMGCGIGLSTGSNVGLSVLGGAFVAGFLGTIGTYYAVTRY